MKQVIQNIVSIILAVLCLTFAVLWLRESIRSERADDYIDYPVPDTVIIRDTVYVPEPTMVSERLFGYEEAVLERADKRADAKLKSELKSELNCNLSAHLINEVSKVAPDTNAATKTTIEDSVAVIVPISEKVYDDSLYRAVVRGYQAELVSLDIYRQHTYYPVVVEKEYDPPNIVVSIGPYVGFGNKGANYGVAISVGIPIWSW